MTIIESLRKYIKQCPYLKEFQDAIKINVDKLEEDTTVYSIDESVFEPIIKKYMDGSSKRQFVFIFASREDYGADVFQNIDNIGFYDDFSKWLEDNTNNKILPDLGENKEALSIKPITNGYAFATDVDKARYQIQLKLEYLQK